MNVIKPHVSLNVSNVDASVAFYEKVFGVAATKRRPGYAKFDLASPPLNLTMQEAPRTGSNASHFGVQVASSEDVAVAWTRFKEAGLKTLTKRTRPAVTRSRTRCGWNIPTATRGRCSSSRKTRRRWGPRHRRRLAARPTSTEPRRPVAAAVDLPRKAVAEALGTALLLATVVGSGIMGESLAGGNVALALLANALATGAALVALILTLAPISGAHFNPAVTLAEASQGGVAWREVPVYVIAQVTGAFGGVATANVMFGKPMVFASHHARAGAAQLVSELVATFGLIAVIWGCARRRAGAVPYAVGAYITAAYWFTASTSFANPAVTLARSASDTFAGIRLEDVPAFVVAQLVGAAAATALFRWLVPALPASVERGVAREEDAA